MNHTMPLTRADAEAVIEALIDWLDCLDGDPDLEPNGDDEPSLPNGRCTVLFWVGRRIWVTA
jgi:hypothetical protein